MIERKLVSQKVKEQLVKEYIMKSLPKAGISDVKLNLTPLGERIIIYSSRPGLVVGSGGRNINKLTEELKTKIGLENPQIETSEVEQPNLDAQIMADKIASYFEKFGSKNFKGIMHLALEDIMNAGAIGAEIVVSGKVPSARAKSWRVIAGHMKKCGDIALTRVRKAKASAQLKSGTLGIKVSIMPPGTMLTDHIEQIKKDETKVQDDKKE